MARELPKIRVFEKQRLRERSQAFFQAKIEIADNDRVDTEFFKALIRIDLRHRQLGDLRERLLQIGFDSRRQSGFVNEICCSRLALHLGVRSVKEGLRELAAVSPEGN